MNKDKICIPVCATTTADLIDKIRKADAIAEFVEVRFDYLDQQKAAPAAESLPKIDGTYILTLRPKSQGGAREICRNERLEFWRRAAAAARANYLFDLEADLAHDRLFDDARTILSYHDFEQSSPDAAVSAMMVHSSARHLKFATAAYDAADAIDVFSLLTSQTFGERQVIAIAMGEAGRWTRILGPAYGGFLTFAAEADALTAPGQMPAGDLSEVYRVGKISCSTNVYGVIAGDTSYSMSPFIHNAGFVAEKIDAVFVPLQVDNLERFFSRMVKAASRKINLNFRGFAVTNPHKQSVIKFLDTLDEKARAIRAVNTIVIDDKGLRGFNTDADGFAAPLIERLGDLSGTRAAILGGGGAARACAFALKSRGSDVTVFSRNPRQASEIAENFNATSTQLADTSSFGAFDIVVNATPVGTKGVSQNATPVTRCQLAGTKIVYDLTYNPVRTLLGDEAAAAGAEFIGGLEMLIAQAAEQFEKWTSRRAPTSAMKRVALARLNTD